jgi:hypothetical protein
MRAAATPPATADREPRTVGAAAVMAAVMHIGQTILAGGLGRHREQLLAGEVTRHLQR